jgi:hypothetical protein
MFCSGQLTLAQLYQPAIELARSGFVVSEMCASGFAGNLDKLLKAGPNGARLLLPTSSNKDVEACSTPAGDMRTLFRAPIQGEVVTNELLARNLEVN